jgi:hypothetical protein
MLIRKTATLLTALGIVFVSACGGGESDTDMDRDVGLLPAESIQTLADTPLADTLPEPAKIDAPAEKAISEEPPAPAPRPPAPPPPPPPSLIEGTAIDLVAADSLQLNDDLVGQTVFATAAFSLLDDRGREVIPAGAVFSGSVSKTEMTDSTGTSEALIMTFDRVEIDGASYGVSALTDSIGFRTEKGGITAGDAAKTGAGAVVGAIAGRIIGGNRTGTLVGAAIGTVAGAGVAIATKGEKVMIDAGSPIRIRLRDPFVRSP